MQTSAIASSTQNQQALQLAASQLSSGKRIASAAVDPSGLAIANALVAQAGGFDQGASNAQAAIDASSVASGAIATISDAAKQLSTFSVAANDGLLSASDRADLQTEANQTTQQINSTASSAQFNGLPLADGSTPTISVQTGASEGDTAALALPSSGAGAVGLSQIDLSSSTSAATSEASADAAITTIGNGQATVGSQTVALQIDQQNSEDASSNLTAAASNTANADPISTVMSLMQERTKTQIQVALQIEANRAVSAVLGIIPR